MRSGGVALFDHLFAVQMLNDCAEYVRLIEMVSRTLKYPACRCVNVWSRDDLMQTLDVWITLSHVHH